MVWAPLNLLFDLEHPILFLSSAAFSIRKNLQFFLSSNFFHYHVVSSSSSFHFSFFHFSMYACKYLHLHSLILLWRITNKLNRSCSLFQKNDEFVHEAWLKVEKRILKKKVPKPPIRLIRSSKICYQLFSPETRITSLFLERHYILERIGIREVKN